MKIELTFLAEAAHWWLDSNWWLVIIAAITGGIISWQSWETRKAAQATRVQSEISTKAFISQFRPKIVLRRMKLRSGLHRLEIEILLKNIGDSQGSLTESEVKAFWLGTERGDVILLNETKFRHHPLEAGEAQTLTVDLNHFALTYAESNRFTDRGRLQRTGYISCKGIVKYRDGNGAERETKFSKIYDTSARRFVSTHDKTDEYVE